MTLTTRIILLVLLALAPALVIQGYNEYALRASRDEAVRADTVATARAVADDLAQVADTVRQSLDLVARDPRVLALDPAACTDYLRGAATDLPHLNLLALTRPDGTVVCNSIGSPPGSYSNAGRAYHRAAMAKGGFAMGGYARGVATGKDSVHFAKPLPGPDGAVASVLVAAVDLDWLSLHLQKDLRLPSTTLTVADPDKVIMIRRPDGQEWVGKPIPSERQKILAERGEGVRVDLGIDGRERVLANATPKGPAAGVWVTVGRDRDVAFADVDAATRRGLVLIGLGVLLALGAALLAARFFIRRPFDRLLRAAAAWREGDLSARIGMARGDEFGRLGRKLDGMAASLQRNEADLRDEITRGREMQERQVTLLHELNHRVKNTLATVQALARQASRGGEAPGERLEARILALSKTHDLLTREDWSGAPLHEVLEGEIGPYRDGPDRFAVDGPHIDLPTRHVLSLGMTIHELVTNAAKHGALSVEDGTVCITWRTTVDDVGARRLCLDWVEEGTPSGGAPGRPGFGSRLIRASVERELDGCVALDMGAMGLRCTLDVPLAASASMLAPHRSSAAH